MGCPVVLGHGSGCPTLGDAAWASASGPGRTTEDSCIAQSSKSSPASISLSQQRDSVLGHGGVTSAKQLVSAATHLQLGKPDVDEPCPSPAPRRASLPCSGDQGDAAESSAEAGAPRHSGGRRTRDLPHLPMRRHGGELMRSKVRGRRRADNLLAPQAAGGVQAAEGRHLPPPASQHL